MVYGYYICQHYLRLYNVRIKFVRFVQLRILISFFLQMNVYQNIFCNRASANIQAGGVSTVGALKMLALLRRGGGAQTPAKIFFWIGYSELDILQFPTLHLFFINYNELAQTQH